MHNQEIDLVDLTSTIFPGADLFRIHLIAGVFSGIVGLIVFLVIHHFWITPIWFILPPGLVFASLGGLAVGWSFHELSPRLPSHPWSALVMVSLIAAILAPAIFLAELRRPLFTITGTGAELSVSIGYAAAVFILELLVTATLAGGFLGWLIGGTPRAAMATGLAGLIFALGPGHNIPFLGSTPGTLKGIVVLIIIVSSASLALVGISALMSGWFAIKN